MGGQNPTDCEVRLTSLNGTVRVVAAGEIDLHSAPVLAEAFGAALSPRPARVVVDLAAVTFCASDGVRCLLSASERAAGLGVPVSIAAASQAVRRVFVICGLEELIPRG